MAKTFIKGMLDRFSLIVELCTLVHYFACKSVNMKDSKMFFFKVKFILLPCVFVRFV